MAYISGHCSIQFQLVQLAVIDNQLRFKIIESFQLLLNIIADHVEEPNTIHVEDAQEIITDQVATCDQVASTKICGVLKL